MKTYYSLVLALSHVSTLPFPTRSPGRKVSNKFNNQLFSVCLNLTSSLRCLFILAISQWYFKNMWEILFFKIGNELRDSRDLSSPLQIFQHWTFQLQHPRSTSFKIHNFVPFIESNGSVRMIGRRASSRSVIYTSAGQSLHFVESRVFVLDSTAWSSHFWCNIWTFRCTSATFWTTIILRYTSRHSATKYPRKREPHGTRAFYHLILDSMQAFSSPEDQSPSFSASAITITELYGLRRSSAV